MSDSEEAEHKIDCDGGAHADKLLQLRPLNECMFVLIRQVN